MEPTLCLATAVWRGRRTSAWPRNCESASRETVPAVALTTPRRGRRLRRRCRAPLLGAPVAKLLDRRTADTSFRPESLPSTIAPTIPLSPCHEEAHAATHPDTAKAPVGVAVAAERRIFSHVLLVPLHLARSRRPGHHKSCARSVNIASGRLLIPSSTGIMPLTSCALVHHAPRDNT
jgi:hypothetical protein